MPSLKIYTSITDINIKRLKNINFYKNFINNNIYLLELLKKKEIIKKEKPIFEYNFEKPTIPQDWKFLFDKTTEIKVFKKNSKQKDLFYISSTLDSLTRLNDRKDMDISLTNEEKNTINQNIDFLYSLPLFSIIIVDFSQELKKMNTDEFLLFDALQEV